MARGPHSPISFCDSQASPPVYTLTYTYITHTCVKYLPQCFQRIGQFLSREIHFFKACYDVDQKFQWFSYESGPFCVLTSSEFKLHFPHMLFFNVEIIIAFGKSVLWDKENWLKFYLYQLISTIIYGSNYKINFEYTKRFNYLLVDYYDYTGNEQFPTKLKLLTKFMSFWSVTKWFTNEALET